MENKADLPPTQENPSQEGSDFEKIMQLNKLGALFLSNDKYDRAQSILQKTLDFYLEKKALKQIPLFFYSILYCNLAKVYSCQKNFKEAEKLYIECIGNHPLFKLLCNRKDFFIEKFGIFNLPNIGTDKSPFNKDNLLTKISNLNLFFDQSSPLRIEFKDTILNNYKSNNGNTISSLTDSLVNLGVIFQIGNNNINAAFDMYMLSILLDEDNLVANVNYNNYLRESNGKEKSDEYIIKRISYANNNQEINIQPAKNTKSLANDPESGPKNINFICMKWGKKYGADYVNKLFNGIKQNTTKTFKLFCITDDNADLDSNIIPIKLETPFTGWMKKSMLFDDKILDQVTKENELLCFIDLDMIIYGNIDFLFDYKGSFCIMNTDDIQCEGSVEGYNSSIVVYRRNFGREIYDTMEKYEKEGTQQVVRFDHYLEFIVKDADFTTKEFNGKIGDYNTYCKGKKESELDTNGAIIAFPRSPKPHECNEDWIGKYWC